MIKKEPTPKAKLIFSNELDQAPKTGKNYQKDLKNPKLQKEIMDAFDKDRGESREEKKSILEREIQLWEKEIGITREKRGDRYVKNENKPSNAIKMPTIKKLKEITKGFWDHFKKVYKINADFEKRLFTEKSPVEENIKNVLFEKKNANVLDIANELAKIKDEQTRLYLFMKLIEEGGDRLFKPHSNYNRDVYNTSNMDKANEIIGLEKYGIKPQYNRTSTGAYYGYYKHLVENALKAKGITIKGSYKVDYADGYNNHNGKNTEKETREFNIPLFFTDPNYIKLQNEFFEKYPDKKKELIKVQNEIKDAAEQTNSIYEKYQTKKEKLMKQEDKVENIIESKKNEIKELQEENEVVSKWSKNNADAYRNFKKEHGDAELLKQLVLNNSKFDLEKFLITTPYKFIETCQRYGMRPCTDGKHQVAIKIDDAPSINTGAGLQYGKNVSIWYDGKTQDKQYFKSRDGYSSSGDIPSNSFNKILDISVDDESGEIKVIAQASSHSPKTIIFQMEKANTEHEIPENKQEDFKKKFETAKTEILKLQTRDTTTALRYNIAYRGDLIQGQDPYQQVPYEKAKVISEAIDYKRGLGAIVISTQIDASARSGIQIGYYAYIIHPNGNREQVRTDNIYADAMKEGQSVNIPDANKLIKEQRIKEEK